MVLFKPVEKFINEKFDLIDSGNWEEVYHTFSEDYASEKCHIGNLTDALMEAGIDPLEGKTYVENYMFYGSERGEIILPEGIQNIGMEAFSDTLDLRKIFIPKSVWEIKFRAFKNAGLQPLPVQLIYAGTREEWVSIKKENGWDYGSNITVRCLGDEK